MIQGGGRRIETCGCQSESGAMISTTGLDLVTWHEEHRLPFCEMHSDPSVMADLGGPFTVVKSNEKFNRYASAWGDYGISRWALIDIEAKFVGYCGVMYRADTNHPLGAHYEIGWRLCRCAWGKGYAYRAATLALEHAWATISATEILSYTAPDNLLSQKVMSRLSLTRFPERDFSANYEDFSAPWHGLVWGATRP
jgi:RimJ/RimL family protein N-acetyltransferase